MAYVYLLLPGSEFSCVFLLIGPLCGMRARYNGAILARNNAFVDSKLRCLVACKYCKQRKRAASELSLNAGFVTQLAGKRVGHGKCRPNLQKAGHLVCLIIIYIQKFSISDFICLFGER